jgi:hypothetical protein
VEVRNEAIWKYDPGCTNGFARESSGCRGKNENGKVIGQIIVSIALVVAAVVMLVLKTEGAKEICLVIVGAVTGYWLK